MQFAINNKTAYVSVTAETPEDNIAILLFLKVLKEQQELKVLKEQQKCDICGREFPNKRGLTIHTTRAHKKNWSTSSKAE